MINSTRLSFSKIQAFSVCGQYYNLRYNYGLQERWSRSSLLFGSAIDNSLNKLLSTRDVEEAKKEFDKVWNFQWIQGKYAALRSNPDVVYADKDLDTDLIEISNEDKKWLKEFKEFKKLKKWDEISTEDRIKYNELNWECLKYKGNLIIEDYNKKVLPRFIKIEAVQEKSEMVSDTGDSVVQYLDFIATLDDGSKILFDNKTTSSMDYFEEDAPASSPQLISYYFSNKEKYSLGAVGFVVILKSIIKNKTKICTKCKFDGSESRAKTCDQEYEGIVVKRNKEEKGMVRCGGAWDETMAPEAAIKVLINPVSDAAENLVIESFEDANHFIKQGYYYKNLTACKSMYGSPCVYREVCWKGDHSEVVKIEKKNNS